MRYLSFFMRAALLAVVLIAAPSIADAASSADNALAKAVSEKLMEGSNDFDATNIIVTSEDGVVNLRGETPDGKSIKRMEDIAQSVPGVKRVESQIDVTNQGR